MIVKKKFRKSNRQILSFREQNHNSEEGDYG